MSNNKLLVLGILTIIAGVALFIYSVNCYAEIKSLSTKIDFEELENNNRMPTSDKYYKYLSYNEILDQSLEKNKKLIIKNSSCAYLDYAQHNIVSLYKLVYKGSQEDHSRREVVQVSVEKLDDMLNNYKTCPNTPGYKKELSDILEEIDKINNAPDNSVIMETFLHGAGEIEPVDSKKSSEFQNPDSGDKYVEEEFDADFIPTPDTIDRNAPVME